MTPATKNMVGASLIALSLFLLWAVDYTEYKKIPALREAITQRETTLAERRAILENVQRLSAEYDQKTADIKRFASIVPAKKEVAEFISTVETVAAQSGIGLEDVSVQDTKKTDQPINALNVVLNLTGSY